MVTMTAEEASTERLLEEALHLTARTKLPDASDYDLLREELAIPYRDPIFERTLARAARLVQ